MDDIEIIDLNDSNSHLVLKNDNGKDVVVLIGSDVEDLRSPVISSPIKSSLVGAFSRSIQNADINEDDVVLLDDTVSINFSMEVDGEFQNDTSINLSIDGERETQTLGYKRSQSNLLDEIEHSAISTSLDHDDEEGKDYSSNLPSLLSNNDSMKLTLQGYKDTSLLNGRIAPARYSTPEKQNRNSTFKLQSSPNFNNEVAGKVQITSKSPAKLINSVTQKRYHDELEVSSNILKDQTHTKRKKIFISQTDNQNETLNNVALDLTQYMHDYETASVEQQNGQSNTEDRGNSWETAIKSPDILPDHYFDSIVVDSENNSPYKGEKRSLFVVDSSQSTPVNLNKNGLRHANSLRDNALIERKTIAHSKYFTVEQYKEMVKKCLSSSEMKQRYNECNKVSRSEETIQKEMILNVNYKTIEIFESKNISLSSELKPITIIQNFEEYPVIWFKRKCSSIYDHNHGIFYPCDEVLVDESICVLVYEALDFFYRYRTDKKALWHEMRQITKRGKKVIVVLYGQNTLRKRLVNMENKLHEDRVRERLPGFDSSQSQSKSKRKSTEEVKIKSLNMRSKDLDRIINEVMIYANVDVFPIDNLNEFTNWMKNLIWVVGKMRYDVNIKHKDWSHLSVKSGNSPSDVLLKFLQQISHVNEAKAKRVVSHYSSFQSLTSDMKAGYVSRGSDKKPLMMKSLERALHTLYTSDDPDELIFTD